MTDLLNINNISVNLQEKVVLSDIQLTLSKGDILGLVGPSGCGKTTLLNTISGFIEQESGEIIIDQDIIISLDNIIPPQHRHIGMIFQDYALFPHLNVETNILFGITKLAKNEQKSRLDQLIELLELTGLQKRFPHQLSGGQQQRVAIARALAPQPKLLLLDEPFSNIDARLRNELMLTMRHLLKTLNMTAIFVTHNIDEVYTFADKMAVMHQGKILQTGEPEKVCRSPNSWQVADFLQLGSWLPIKHISASTFQTAIGNIDLQDVESNTHTISLENNKPQLLVKPQYIKSSATINANVCIEHRSITEQGYHYILSSITKDEKLQFEKLSFYSEEVISIGQKLSVTIEPHEYVIFNNAQI